LADDFYELYESKADLYNATLKFQDISKAYDQTRVQFDEQLKADFIDPVSKYLGQYKEIKIRLEEENTRRVDMDRYNRDARGHQEKANSSRYSVAQQKYETAKVNYNNLHDELTKDMTLLFDDRIPFFDPALATFLTGMSEYYRGCAKASAESLSLVSHIDRKKILEHERVVTSADESTATHKVTVPVSTLRDREPSARRDPVDNTDSTPSTVPTKVPLPTPPRNNSSSAIKQQRAKAVFDFTAQESNELSFRVGDIITILNTKGEWWEGEMNGARGLLPCNYVQLIQ